MMSDRDWLQLGVFERQVIREITSIRIAVWIVAVMLVAAPIALIVAALAGL